MTKERLQRLLFLTECGELLPEGFAELDALRVEFAAWEPEIEARRLREALRKYGRHNSDCRFNCICGLAEVLKL